MPATHFLRGHVIKHGSSVDKDGNPVITLVLKQPEGGDRQVIASGRVAQVAATLLSPGTELIVTGTLRDDGVLHAISVSEL